MTGHLKKFDEIGKTIAYKELVCANGWNDPATKHTAPRGALLFRVMVSEWHRKDMATKDKINVYCQPCYEQLLSEHIAHKAQLERVDGLDL